jgi:hypothetical protein
LRSYDYHLIFRDSGDFDNWKMVSLHLDMFVQERSAYGDGASDNEIKHKKSADAEGTAVSHAVYELTAMIAHIRDDFDNDRLFHDEGEGHLVAHVKVKNVAPPIRTLLS